MPGLQSSSPLKTALNPIGKSRPEVHVNAERWNQANPKNGKYTHAANDPAALSARMALEEVFELLEDYAPVWYTEELHDRILAALLNRDE
jgi:hypothetical protein